MKKSAIFLTAVLLVSLISGCGVQHADLNNTTLQGNTVSTIQEGVQDAGPTVPVQDGNPDYEPDFMIQEKCILPKGATAVIQETGISYSVQSVECSREFGNRSLENLTDLSSGLTDDEGNLLGNERYLFATIKFENISDKNLEINRNSGGPCVITSDYKCFPCGEAVYVDQEWTGGTLAETFHWILKPGESITSEVGWLIFEWENVQLPLISGGSQDLQGESVYYRAFLSDILADSGNRYIDLGLRMGES